MVWGLDPLDELGEDDRDGEQVAALAASTRSLEQLDARSSVCRACPRLVEWREHVADVKRRAFIDETYWGRPAPGFGDPAGHLLVVGLAPAAHGANRTGRLFTGDRSGDWIFAALYRAGYANQPESVAADDVLQLTGCRIVPAVRCAPPDNRPTPDERAACAVTLEHAKAHPGLEAAIVLGLQQPRTGELLIGPLAQIGLQ